MNSESLQILKSRLENGEEVSVSGLTPSSKPYFLFLLQRITSKSIIFISPDSFASEGVCDAFSVFSDVPRLHIDLKGAGAEESSASLLSLPPVCAAFSDISSAFEKLQDPSEGSRSSILLKRGMRINMEHLAGMLAGGGFRKTGTAENRKEFSVRGGIFDIFPPAGEPVRIEFFGDEIDSLRVFDPETQRSREEIGSASVYTGASGLGSSSIFDYFSPESSIAVFDEMPLLRLGIIESGAWGVSPDSEEGMPDAAKPQNDPKDIDALISGLRGFPLVRFEDFGKKGDIDFSVCSPPSFGRKIDSFVSFVRESRIGDRFAVFSSQMKRLSSMLLENSVPVKELISGSPDFRPEMLNEKISVSKRNLAEGFIWDGSLFFITDSELLGSKRLSVKKAKRRAPLKLEALVPGDFVVHSAYGIGLYEGLETKSIGGISSEFLKIRYEERKHGKPPIAQHLFLPVDQIYLIDRFVRGDEQDPQLSDLNGREWSKTKQKAKEDAEKTAAELLKIYAERQASEGFRFSADAPWQAEFEDAFPYVETPDQLKAICDAKRDMESEHPMERLICGDAGFGKTEVALRCAFKAVMDGRQVAFLAPTTILAEQHFSVFCERMASFPVRIELLSRFRKKSEQRDAVLRAASGECDILIGTHRILSKDVSFKNLGLVIIDEEQYFGVMHKEKLRQLKAGVDTLMLSATPIPRTLNLTLSGIKDLSLISTPPQNRLPVMTRIAPFSRELVKAVIMREKARGGQVFFLHNRIDGIEAIVREIEEMIPGIRAAGAHARMGDELDRAVKDFASGEYDVLVCTTVIQSGLDMPGVNTIIINNAYNFGLAQLYQIRGRVGRGNRQAYAYLLYPPNMAIMGAARRRMEVLRDFTELGSGFHIAMKDLEMRGTGDILGKSQHGFIQSVGFSMYCSMLEDAVLELKGEKKPEPLGDPVMRLPFSAYIPDSYVQDPKRKLTLYRKLAAAQSSKDVLLVKDEMRDIYGTVPDEVHNLCDAACLKLLLKRALIPVIECSGADIRLFMPFAEFSRQFTAKLRSKKLPLGIEGSRIVLFGILKDEYWMEILCDFVSFIADISENSSNINNFQEISKKL